MRCYDATSAGRVDFYDVACSDFFFLEIMSSDRQPSASLIEASLQVKVLAINSLYSVRGKQTSSLIESEYINRRAYCLLIRAETAADEDGAVNDRDAPGDVRRCARVRRPRARARGPAQQGRRWQGGVEAHGTWDAHAILLDTRRRDPSGGRHRCGQRAAQRLLHATEGVGGVDLVQRR